MNNRVHDSIVEEAVAAERLRCEMLIKMRSDMVRRDAARLRERGAYPTTILWPLRDFGKRVVAVLPKWEQRARDMDAVAEAFDSVQRGVRQGWDPRKIEVDPDERIHPAPQTDGERLDALGKANGIG